MPKDWNDFREQYIKNHVDYLKHKLDRLEQQFTSPIERIAFINLAEAFEPDMNADIVKLETQKKIGPYIADFYLSYKNGCLTFEAIIECDGHEFHQKTKEQAAHDKKRDRYFTTNGYKVLRYTGSEILKDAGIIIRDIYEIIHYCEGYLVGIGKL